MSTGIRPGRPRKPDALSAAERMANMRARRKDAGLRLVQAWVPEVPPLYSDHMRLDARSLALHCAVARQLLEDPTLLDRARATLALWKRAAPRPRPGYFAEWERIMRRPLEEIAGFIVSMSEDAVRLRQSSPFAPLLSPQQRRRIYAAFR
jgi:hypothetical protein